VKARFLSTAEAELVEAINYYAGQAPGLGARFLAEVEAAVGLIEAHPQAWTPLSPRTRRCRVQHFSFGLFYQVRAEKILIVTVMVCAAIRSDESNSCELTVCRRGDLPTGHHHKPVGGGLTPAMRLQSPGFPRLRKLIRTLSL